MKHHAAFSRLVAVDDISKLAFPRKSSRLNSSWEMQKVHPGGAPSLGTRWNRSSEGNLVRHLENGSSFRFNASAYRPQGEAIDAELGFSTSWLPKETPTWLAGTADLSSRTLANKNAIRKRTKMARSYGRQKFAKKKTSVQNMLPTEQICCPAAII
jgi:hypothetical protein